VLCWISLAVASWIGLCFLVQKHFYPVSMGLRKSFIYEKPDFYATLGLTLMLQTHVEEKRVRERQIWSRAGSDRMNST